jgi:DNA-3-methyladenine glycosylase
MWSILQVLPGIAGRSPSPKTLCDTIADVNRFEDDSPFELAAVDEPSAAFFARSTEKVAHELLGCIIASNAEGELAAGRIVETEAYLGIDDPGSHAATKGITARNAVMYGPPGTAYVYFTYGNHFMLNVVCEPPGTAGAVLIRALKPVLGIATMTRRREGRGLRDLCSGPGKLCQALGVDSGDNGVAFGQGRLAIYLGDLSAQERVATSGRVGLTRGHEMALRYYLHGDPYVSRGRTGPRAGK